jgi:protein O-GlcNAc transferase
MFDWLRSRKPRPQVSAQEAAERWMSEGRQKEAQGRLAEACELYRRAVAAAPQLATAHLNLGIGLAAAGDAEGAIRSYESALSLDPGEPYASYNLGCLLFMRGELARAEELLRSALGRKPGFAEAHVALANVLDARHEPAAAAAQLELALKQRPDFAGAWHNYGIVLKNMGRLAEAEQAVRRAAGIDPACGPGTVLNDIGIAHAANGAPADAERVFRDAIALQPGAADAYASLALLLASLGRLDEGLACLQSGLARAPGVAALHYQLGNLLAQAGRGPDAAAAYRAATVLQPTHFAAHYGLAIALRDQGAHDEVRVCLETLMRLTPQSADEHFGLANVLRDADRFDQMLAELRKALELDPEHVQARWALTMNQLPAVYIDDDGPRRARAAFAAELAALDEWLDSARAARAVEAVGAPPPFLLAYQEESNRELLARHGRICARVMGEWRTRQRLPASGTCAKRVPLRVGVVSQFFFNHSVWHAPVRGWFEHFDPARVALHAFYLGARRDEQTRFAMERAAHFEIVGGGVRALAEAVLARDLDVLIYPEIGMHPATVRLASLRLAPVQIVSWGHPETSGLPTLDYYLSGADFEPSGAQAHYTETLVPLPNLGCWYAARDVGSTPPDLRALGLDGAAPLLLCAGTPFKYGPHHDAVFVRIAKQLGRCQFVFFRHEVNPRFSDKLRERLQSAFSREGMRAEQFVRFVPWQNGPQFFGLMQRAHVYLDTIGFSGFNTAMQAIECGLPIVTREGRFMRGRFASAILKRMDLAELIAASDEAYAELAVRVVRDDAYRESLRRRIAQRRAPLFGDVATVRALEDFLIRSAAPRPG